MANLKRNSPVIGFVAIIAVLGALFFAYSAKANPSDFSVTKSATATTTETFIASGATVIGTPYDSFNGDPNAADSSVLLVQFSASSTSSVLGIKVQYSQDGIDWYDDNLLESTNSTSTPAYSMQVANSYTWTAAGTATAFKAITEPTPTRFTREVYTMAGANGSVWTSRIVKKETPE